jgi:methylmalonyl-CoA mutase N-terminal domain/subunit
MNYFARIDAMGGMVEAIERGFPQREIAESAYTFQRSVEFREKVVVGVNEFASPDTESIPTLYIDESTAERQMAKLERLRRTRDNDRVLKGLDRLRSAAAGSDNTMIPLIECARAYATVGEMCDALRDVWGEYQEEVTI